MKKIQYLLLLASLAVSICNQTNAQVKIKDGTVAASPAAPVTDAALELESTKKGLLFPRVALVGTGSPAPLSSHIQGMTVFNTASVGDVSPGIYYNDGLVWIRVAPYNREPWNVSGTSNPANSNTQNLYQMGKVAIGIDPGAAPTTMLDVNGDLRVRTIPQSTSTQDVTLVADAGGNVKKALIESKGIMRGYITTNFTAGNTNGAIYKITNITDIQDPNSDFDAATSFFTAPLTGIYKITLTLTLTSANTTPASYVFGFVNNSTGDWALRFTLPDQLVENGLSSGAAYTWSGVLSLTQGESYYFGTSRSCVIHWQPTGSTGSGLGTFFEVQLMQN